VQLGWLASTGPFAGVDELASEFDEARLWVDRLEQWQWVAAGCAERVHRLGELIDGFSGDGSEHLWEPNALAGAAEWAQVRELARGILYLVN
jgi:class 3 adenylate cyclase